ncbi:uncharacterized protein FOMMEDRAFT_160209 [Fomitiporia mediterranea MF3/22]|uniref:uncharacterized protein n=1 Tax=Fomitiporia mediterranea (strain MF3/22) TaxID=694068 RepID=UPI0004408ADF|nr:uncharacterized protein FOMMEDRAFT_160209 [Fomitiporia mediterranea MF3/22]EJC99765.1 hypothetical protein FOMMEDRAFT_160209 [Fomitiporia mediterranea MF3/22]
MADISGRSSVVHHTSGSVTKNAVPDWDAFNCVTPPSLVRMRRVMPMISISRTLLTMRCEYLSAAAKERILLSRRAALHRGSQCYYQYGASRSRRNPERCDVGPTISAVSRSALFQGYRTSPVLTLQYSSFGKTGRLGVFCEPSYDINSLDLTGCTSQHGTQRICIRTLQGVLWQI